MESSTRSRCRAWAGLALLLAAQSSWAGSDAPVDPAREQMLLAQKEYDVGHFEPALQAYSEAYRLRPLPGFLFNIAQCHRQLGHYERAAFFYRRYLDLTDHPANAHLARELLDEVQARAERAEADAEARRHAMAAFSPAATVNSSPKATERPTPLVKQWWFWTGIGVVAAGAVAITWVATAPRPLSPTLGTINDR